MIISSKDICRFWSKVDKTEYCWYWTAGKFHDGYGQFQLNKKPQRAHRIAYEIHNGRIQTGMVVCHKCDNPGCVNPDHLFLGTHSDNAKDKVVKGRQQRMFGPANGRAKISLSDANEIRDLYKSNLFSAMKIGTMYGISESQIFRIVKNIQMNKEGLLYGNFQASF